MRFKPFFLLVFISPLLFVCKKSPKEPVVPIDRAGKPNIIFILADDMGFNDLQHHLSLRPNTRVEQFINQEATEVENFTVMANCSPSRHAFISGQYGFKNGRSSYGMKESIPNYGLLSQKTIAEEMKENGYKTGLFGKWHLAETATPDPNTFPFNRGFDRFFGSIGGSINYYTHRGTAYYDLYDQDQCVQSAYQGSSVTDLIREKTNDFIEANRTDPFFAFVSFTAPHKPYVVSRLDDGSYGGCDAPDVKRFWIMEELVANIEAVLNKVDDLGLRNNTVLILTSDNGGIKDECGSNTFNAPLRDFKGSLYDGGIRARFYVRYPKEGIGGGLKIPMTTATNIVDMYPTFTALAEGKVDIATDGVNVVPFWKGNADPNRVVINDLVPNARYVARAQGYKLASNAGDRITDLDERPQNWELFNLVLDPGETTNLFGTGLAIEQVLMDNLFDAQVDYVAPVYEKEDWVGRDCLID